MNSMFFNVLLLRTLFILLHENILIIISGCIRSKLRHAYLECYKSKFVAKGYSQEYELDYEEMFALMAKMTSILLLCMLLPFFIKKLYKLNVKIIVLNKNIFEEVYMIPHPRLSHPLISILCEFLFKDLRGQMKY